MKPMDIIEVKIAYCPDENQWINGHIPIRIMDIIEVKQMIYTYLREEKRVNSYL